MRQRRDASSRCRLGPCAVSARCAAVGLSRVALAASRRSASDSACCGHYQSGLIALDKDLERVGARARAKHKKRARRVRGGAEEACDGAGLEGAAFPDCDAALGDGELCG